MKRPGIYSAIILSAVCLLILSAAAITPIKINYPAGDKKVPVIELKGSGYERGIQHGTLLKNEIAEIMRKWKDNISKTTGRNADSVIIEFIKATNFEPAIKKSTPEVFDEMKGIAEGSKQKYNDVYVYQLVDELWVYLDRLAYDKNHHCSGLAVPGTKNKPAMVAQNLDIDNFYHSSQILLHIAKTETEPEQYVYGFAGLVGASGINANGIGVCVNTIMELKASADGLPVAFVVRGVLSKQNGQEAISFLTKTKHASGQNYILGVKDSVYNFEASANQVVRFLPKGKKNSLVYHTNHAFVNHDVKEWWAGYHKTILGDGAQRMDSGIRHLALEKRLDMPVEEITIDVVKAALRSKDNERSPVCRPFYEKGRIFTSASLIYSLGSRPSVQLTYGPPDTSEYVEHLFKN